MPRSTVSVGDLAGKRPPRSSDTANLRAPAGADLMLTPELALCGTPRRPSVARRVSIATATPALERLAREVSGITSWSGIRMKIRGSAHNAASVVKDGRILGTYYKQVLPNYTVSTRTYFEPGDRPCVFFR